MIIDIHGHVVAPPEVNEYQATLLANRGYPDAGAPKISDDRLKQYADKLIGILDSVGTDMQFISPRPFQAMHSVKPAKVVHKWTAFINDVIARQVKMHPDRIRGVAGLPQSPGEPITAVLPELERCVKELGFVGCQLNPDPCEGDFPRPPGLGEEYWYPLYEKLVEYDIPALIHSSSCCQPRESYTLHFINEESIAIMSLLDSDVFKLFPKLKIVVPHTGGAIPFHMGRFRAWRWRTGAEEFDVSMKKLYFDTVNYSREPLELLFKVIGTDNVLFATENPGTGTVVDPHTGKSLDDLKPIIESIEWLSEEDKSKIFEKNARKLYKID